MPVIQLSPEQRTVLTDIDTNLRQDFALRRRMLLKRLDVTLQSFLWAEKAKGVEATIGSAVNGKREGLREEAMGAFVLSARLDPDCEETKGEIDNLQVSK